MKLKTVLSKTKEIYYESFIFYIYEHYILAVPLIKMLVDVDYLSEKIKKSFLFRNLDLCSIKLLQKLPDINIKCNHLTSAFLILVTAIFFDIEFYSLKYIYILVVFVFCIKYKNHLYFTANLLSLALLYLINIYGAERISVESFVLWCSGNSFYITFKTTKKHKLKFLKCIFYINVFVCVASFTMEKNVFYTRFLLYVLPFSLSYTVLSYKKAKKLAVFSFVILLSVLSALKTGRGIVYGLAFEVLIFCALYNIKYIFLAVLTIPVAITSLINKILVLRKEFLSAGITIKNVILSIFLYINNGIKGEVVDIKSEITENVYRINNISTGEQLLICSALVFLFIVVLFFGRYILRIARKTLLSYKTKSLRKKVLISGAISFFAGTSITTFFSPFNGNINLIIIYWTLLGFINAIKK